MLANEIMQNHATLVLEIKLLLEKWQKNETLPYYDPNSYNVYSKKGNMIVARRDGHAITRNSLFFQKVSQNMLDDSYSDYEEQK